MTGEPKPSGGCSGESEGTNPGRPNLAVTVQRFAARLRRDFAPVIARDPKKFKRQVVFFLKRELPPGPGRPAEDATTRAIALRKQHVEWKAIYPQCIPHHSELPPAERRLAEQNLRAAPRSRRNAARRRKRRRSLIAEAIAAPNVPSSAPSDSGL